MTILKKPLHPIAFTVFPILSLLATNIREVDARVAIRPALLAIGVLILLFVFAKLLIRNTLKAALVISLLIVLFFSYGHIYQLVKNTEVFDFVIGRHRYLFPLTAMVFILGTWAILRKLKDAGRITQILNIISIGLLIYPTVFLINFSIRTQIGLKKASEANLVGQPLQVPDSGVLPDIYYIVLDTYTRADALLSDFDFDNSAFLDELENLGFYVADCSRSNYTYTLGSITSALNMDYLPQLEGRITTLGLETEDFWILLKQSLVRSKLEEIGYTSVAFETGYEWSSIRDADIYLAMHENSISLQRILSPFESILFDSTAAILIPHGKMQLASIFGGKENETSENWMSHSAFIKEQLFILGQLPKIANIPEPTFTIAHILIPHVPYVFDAEGNIWTDPGFYSGERDEPVDDWHQKVGYTNEIQFINSQMLKIASTIINISETDPIIIIHGDHGFKDDSRLLIFNTYYLSKEATTKLYPSISPVNSFRLVFDSYFGTNDGLIPDLSYFHDEATPRPETSPDCLPR